MFPNNVGFIMGETLRVPLKKNGVNTKFRPC